MNAITSFLLKNTFLERIAVYTLSRHEMKKAISSGVLSSSQMMRITEGLMASRPGDVVVGGISKLSAEESAAAIFDNKNASGEILCHVVSRIHETEEPWKVEPPLDVIRKVVSVSPSLLPVILDKTRGAKI